MTYIAATAGLLFCHLLFWMSKRGVRFPTLVEKLSVWLAVMLSLVAIVDLCRAFLSAFEKQDGPLAGWMPRVVAYPAGLILFLIVVFLLLPKPIDREKQAQQ
ncbi:MAG: hypothetical protein H7A46_05180 [Verrucomicrobiales bacterium]|nr:hypothetical protein [Verrucomicrobiales bacterium]